MININIFLKIITNGYVLILPILLWNIIFISKLPACYRPEYFNNNIPSFIFIGENILRAIVLIFPLLLTFNISSSQGKKGLIIYTIGCVLYFASWLMLIYLPDLAWSKSILVFTAPAYTPIIWLIGIAFLLDKYYFNFQYTKWQLIVPAILFTIFHVIHTVIVYLRCSV